jgi:hypothetical protein
MAALDMGPEHWREQFRTLRTIPTKLRAELFINCWHMNEGESLAMWKLYAAHQESIGVQSTYAKLVQLLPDPCLLGVVTYIDYDSGYIGWGNMLNNIVHKRRAFEHERELRAVVWTSMTNIPRFEQLGDQGLKIPVDLNSLIENIYISPTAEPIMQEIVSSLAQKYGLSASVHKSSVNAPPAY